MPKPLLIKILGWCGGVVVSLLIAGNVFLATRIIDKLDRTGHKVSQLVVAVAIIKTKLGIPIDEAFNAPQMQIRPAVIESGFGGNYEEIIFGVRFGSSLAARPRLR